MEICYERHGLIEVQFIILIRMEILNIYALIGINIDIN